MKIRNILITIALSILTVLILVGSWIKGALIDQRAAFPKGLKLGSVLYENKISYLVGPGGLNRTFTVYELPAKTADRISDGGVEYLKPMPLSLGEKVRVRPPRHFEGGGKMVAPWWGRFNDWQPTPVPAGGKWGGESDSDNKKGKEEEEWQPTLVNYYGDFYTSQQKFVSEIPSNFGEIFEEIVSTPGAFFTYGGYRGGSILVVAPSHQMAFYLFQD